MNLLEQLINANCYYMKLDNLIGLEFDEFELVVIIYCEGMRAESMMDAIPVILGLYPKAIILQGANADEMLAHFEEEIFLLESTGDDDAPDPSITTHISIEETQFFAFKTLKVQMHEKNILVWDFEGNQNEKLKNIDFNALSY
jgi:hypothetical protein